MIINILKGLTLNFLIRNSEITLFITRIKLSGYISFCLEKVFLQTNLPNLKILSFTFINTSVNELNYNLNKWSPILFLLFGIIHQMSWWGFVWCWCEGLKIWNFSFFALTVLGLVKIATFTKDKLRICRHTIH